MAADGNSPSGGFGDCPADPRSVVVVVVDVVVGFESEGACCGGD